MKRPLIIAASALVLGAGGFLFATGASLFSAQSASAQVASLETQTFAIENMTCSLCPVTVKRAMEGVEGVRSVNIDFDAKTATVVFDPRVANVERIAAASTNAGYPASLRG